MSTRTLSMRLYTLVKLQLAPRSSPTGKQHSVLVVRLRDRRFRLRAEARSQTRRKDDSSRDRQLLNEDEYKDLRNRIVWMTIHLPKWYLAAIFGDVRKLLYRDRQTDRRALNVAYGNSSLTTAFGRAAFPCCYPMIQAVFPRSTLYKIRQCKDRVVGCPIVVLQVGKTAPQRCADRFQPPTEQVDRACRAGSH